MAESGQLVAESCKRLRLRQLSYILGFAPDQKWSNQLRLSCTSAAMENILLPGKPDSVRVCGEIKKKKIKKSERHGNS